MPGRPQVTSRKSTDPVVTAQSNRGRSLTPTYRHLLIPIRNQWFDASRSGTRIQTPSRKTPESSAPESNSKRIRNAAARATVATLA